uniref:Ubiquitin-like modifier-activating enzyme ATG7 n=2 Tax=Parascaris univalens TaxID=6257 RepID=A0A914ZTC2_PARUN
MGEMRFMPLSTFVEASFWNELNRKKLNEWKLDEAPQVIFATYCNLDQESSSSRLSLSYDAFCKESAFSNAAGVIAVCGRMLVLNTLVSFKTLDRKRLLADCGDELKRVISSDLLKDQNNFSLLTTFCLTLFADLKHFHYWYWNCVPALLYPHNLKMISGVSEVDDTMEKNLHDMSRRFGGSPFFLFGGECAPLSQLFGAQGADMEANEVTIVFSDPSTHAGVPGWPLRNLLAAVAYHKRSWCRARFIAHRANPSLPSIFLHIGWTRCANEEDEWIGAGAVGWERSQEGTLEPTFVDMSSSFDPAKLVDEGVRLNLSLIRWRLVPEIDLQRFSNLRCLILGSGTLGCNVARGLLAWGVRHIVFVDSAHVSYSNPVRQSLFELADAVGGTTSKAIAAAERLLRIVPSVESVGVEMKIPMPGHTVAVQDEGSVKDTVEKLESLIKDSDVVFLVMDSREARWLPTLLCTAHGKLAISVAMGFDSYVVIRHGVTCFDGESEANSAQTSDKLLIAGSELGCYFCSDVTAPGNSMQDRTLDQQCTVSRAGVSMAAAGMSVELLASVLQHPKQGLAPARIGEVDDTASVLGAAPHQIRAFISRFHQMTPTVRRFERCVACGEAVLSAYRKHSFAFLLRVFNEPKHLECISGLEQLQASAEQLRIEFDDDDNESVSLSSQ